MTTSLAPKLAAPQHRPAAAAPVPRLAAQRDGRRSGPDAARAGRPAALSGGRAGAAAGADAGAGRGAGRDAARLWRSRAAGPVHPVADQPAERARPGRSLAAALAGGAGRRVLLLDWGWPDRDAAQSRRSPGHVEDIAPAADRGLGEPADLVGYCLGGTMALAAAQLGPCAQRRDDRRAVAFLRLPGRCARRSRAALGGRRADRRRRSACCRWRCCRAPSGASIRPAPSPSSRPSPTMDEAPRRRTFVTLEDWANDGPPLAGAAAREMFEDFFARRPAGQRAHGGSAARSSIRRRSPARSSTSSRPPTASSPPRARPAPASGSISRSAMSAWSSARGAGSGCGSRWPAGFRALRQSC